MILRKLLVLALALSALGATAHAAWPERPVHLIVTFPAGGASDIVARLVATPLSRLLGQPVVVDNKPGAGGTIGGQEVARAPADGYTLMLTNSGPTSIGPFTVPKLPYDPVKQFTHVAMLGVAPVLLMGNPKTGPASLNDLPKAAAAAAYTFGSGGPGSIGHIVGELAKSAMNFQMTHIPYRGGAPMTVDLISGQIPVGIDVITAFVPLVRSGQIRGLAVTTRVRSPLLPEVPTVTELGLPGLVAENYFGISGPAGLPAEVVDKLTAAIDTIITDPAVAQRLEELGITVVKGHSPKFTEFVAKQVADWAPAIKAANVKP
ncbi:MAG: hypothetical protein RJA10_2885 [Pseudomonadota bacterium]